MAEMARNSARRQHRECEEDRGGKTRGRQGGRRREALGKPARTTRNAARASSPGLPRSNEGGRRGGSPGAAEPGLPGLPGLRAAGGARASDSATSWPFSPRFTRLGGGGPGVSPGRGRPACESPANQRKPWRKWPGSRRGASGEDHPGSAQGALPRTAAGSGVGRARHAGRQPPARLTPAARARAFRTPGARCAGSTPSARLQDIGVVRAGAPRPTTPEAPEPTRGVPRSSCRADRTAAATGRDAGATRSRHRTRCPQARTGRPPARLQDADGLQAEVAQHHHAHDDAVHAEGGEVVLLDVAHQKLDG